MIREIYGKKIGMTQLFNENGSLLAATLLEVEPVYVLEKVEYPAKTKARIGCFKIEEKKTGKVSKPVKGYFDKLGFSAYRLVREVEVEKDADFSFKAKEEPKEAPKEEAKEAAADKAPQEQETKEQAQDEAKKAQPQQGSEESTEKSVDPRLIGVEIFKENELVDVRAKSKGKGFAGGMKRYGWSGQPASHGSTTHRRIGSVGASAYPSKVIKGLHMPGHMGNSPRTTKNLKILKIDKEKNVLFVEGSVPGSRGTVVKIRKIN